MRPWQLRVEIDMQNGYKERSLSSRDPDRFLLRRGSRWQGEIERDVALLLETLAPDPGGGARDRACFGAEAI